MTLRLANNALTRYVTRSGYASAKIRSRMFVISQKVLLNDLRDGLVFARDYFQSN